MLFRQWKTPSNIAIALQAAVICRLFEGGSSPGPTKDSFAPARQRNPLKRLVSDKEIKRNTSLFLG